MASIDRRRAGTSDLTASAERLDRPEVPPRASVGSCRRHHRIGDAEASAGRIIGSGHWCDARIRRGRSRRGTSWWSSVAPSSMWSPGRSSWWSWRAPSSWSTSTSTSWSSWWSSKARSWWWWWSSGGGGGGTDGLEELPVGVVDLTVRRIVVGHELRLGVGDIASERREVLEDRIELCLGGVPDGIEVAVGAGAELSQLGRRGGSDCIDHVGVEDVLVPVVGGGDDRRQRCPSVVDRRSPRSDGRGCDSRCHEERHKG